MVADALSRIDSLSASVTSVLIKEVATIEFPTIVDAETLQKHQSEDAELKKILANPNHPLRLQKIKWGSG